MTDMPHVFATRLLTLTVFCLASIGATLAQAPVELQPRVGEVGRFEKIEFRLAPAAEYLNPFNPDEVDLTLQVTTPAGRTLTVPAFYCQEYERRRVGQPGQERDWIYPRGRPVWKVRFAPMEVGLHSAVAVLKDRVGAVTSAPCTFKCLPSDRKGFVRVSRGDPRFLEFTSGQPFFPVGQNLAFIGSQQYVTLSKAEEIFTRLAENGANYLRIWTCCEDWAMAIEARKSAWGRSWDFRAPIVPIPESDNTSRRCLKLSTGSTLSVDPSHPVGLCPETRYKFSGRIRTDNGGAIKMEVHGSDVTLSSTLPGSWSDFEREFQTGPAEFWLQPLRVRLEGTGSALISDLSLKESAGGPELLWEADVNRPSRGYYNPVDCFMLDEILTAAQGQGIYLQLCLLTRDLYMDALKNPSSADYDRAIEDAKRFFRYAVARWGYSTSVAAWEYWNEMNPGLPTDRFYSALGEYLEQIDPYQHLRTTSTWGPSAKDCRHAKIDFADVHFYLRPSDKARLRDEVDAVGERTRWLREQAPNKPAHLGEFGLANEKWQPTEEMKQSKELVDFHNALWASALSGASGTAMFWWWDRLDQRTVYPQYRPLSAFIRDVPWNSGEIQPVAVKCSDETLQVLGLRAGHRNWLWLFNPAASWSGIVIGQHAPGEIQGASVRLEHVPSGHYRVEWWDTHTGTLISKEARLAVDGELVVTPPSFTEDIACKLSEERL
jgi:hypothetical protein